MKVSPTPGLVTVGQFNVWNFFDAKDDPRTSDTVYSRQQYAARLDKVSSFIAKEMDAPDILALQEFENEATLKDLIGAPAMAKLGYEYVMGEHADSRGIRNAILYRADRVKLESVEHPNVDTDLSPEDPGGPAATKLFARAPIMATFSRAGVRDAQAGAKFTVIANHFKSKLGGAEHEPRREAQGAFVGDLVDSAQIAQPSTPVMVLGDLNALPEDGAYKKLINGKNGARVVDVVDRLPEADRYTYIYKGQKNRLDHMMVTPGFADAIEGVRIMHLNSGTSTKQRFDQTSPNGTSDHDPILASIRLP